QQRLREQRNLRRAELQFPVMRKNHVNHQVSQAGRKVREAPELFQHDLHSDLDVPQKLPFRGITETARILEFADFADVVQHYAREQQVEIDVRVVRGAQFRQMAQGKNVLDQTADPIVVNGFGCGRGAVGAGDLFVGKNSFQQTLQMRVRHSF